MLLDGWLAAYELLPRGVVMLGDGDAATSCESSGSVTDGAFGGHELVSATASCCELMGAGRLLTLRVSTCDDAASAEASAFAEQRVLGLVPLMGGRGELMRIWIRRDSVDLRIEIG